MTVFSYNRKSIKDWDKYTDEDWAGFDEWLADREFPGSFSIDEIFYLYMLN